MPLSSSSLLLQMPSFADPLVVPMDAAVLLWGFFGTLTVWSVFLSLPLPAESLSSCLSRVRSLRLVPLCL